MFTRKILILIVSILGTFIVKAQNVDVVISGGIDNISLKNSIEKNASTLLSEINRANRSGSHSLNLEGISMTPDAQRSIAMLWDYTPFFCQDDLVVENVLQRRGGGYQMRNINLELTPKVLSEGDETYQQAVIDFDRYGKIESFNFAIRGNQYKNIFENGKHLSDFHRRQIILENVEQFRTAYNQKDIDYLEKVFSEDALIITGKKITRKKNDFNILSQSQVKQQVQSKREYLDRLKNNVFKNNAFINVDFDEIEIQRHRTKEKIYGVSLLQKYSASGGYHDEGYLYLVWDFKDEDNPQIKVRVWEEKDAFLNGEKFNINIRKVGSFRGIKR